MALATTVSPSLVVEVADISLEAGITSLVLLLSDCKIVSCSVVEVELSELVIDVVVVENDEGTVVVEVVGVLVEIGGVTFMVDVASGAETGVVVDSLVTVTPSTPTGSTEEVVAESKTSVTTGVVNVSVICSVSDGVNGLIDEGGVSVEDNGSGDTRVLSDCVFDTSSAAIERSTG